MCDMATQGRRVHSIEKAIRLLDCFWEEGGPLSLAELVQKTGWAKSTIHGMLSSMLDSAVVEQNPSDGKYRLGYHLFELGYAVNTSWDVVRFARPHMEHIVTALNESVNLARLSGDALVLVDCAAPRVGYRIAAETGCRLPLHCSSQGKAILAFRPDKEAEAMLRRTQMERYTDRTITDPEVLLRQLQVVRQTGLAEEYEEYRTGLYSVAAPIFDGTGACTYAMSIIGVDRGSRIENLEEVRSAIATAARAISHDLGYRRPRP